jgi:divalent metal cation (Fe/Co/Zn/Cd) transporter
LALLLGLAATYYVIELWARIAKGLPTPAKPAWLKWLVVLALLGFLVWNYWMGAMRLQEAIDALAKSS